MRKLPVEGRGQNWYARSLLFATSWSQKSLPWIFQSRARFATGRPAVHSHLALLAPGEIIVNGGCDHQRQNHRSENAADDCDSEGLQHLRAGAPCK